MPTHVAPRPFLVSPASFCCLLIACVLIGAPQSRAFSPFRIASNELTRAFAAKRTPGKILNATGENERATGRRIYSRYSIPGSGGGSIISSGGGQSSDGIGITGGQGGAITGARDNGGPRGLSHGGGFLENYTTAFEVKRPIEAPKGARGCRVLLLRHTFGNSFGEPAPSATYIPPADCGQAWRQVVLRWSAHSIGRQFDRIAAVWIGGVEVLRTSTEEPSETGVKWRVEKDITKYASYLSQAREVTVMLQNVVEGIYTGYYHVLLEATFYASAAGGGAAPPAGGPSADARAFGSAHRAASGEQPADLIVPISAPPPGARWFDLSHNASWRTVALPALPRNIVRAELEIYATHHGADEFYWGNAPNKYKEALPTALQGNVYGGGVFREIRAYVDRHLAGTVWPYPLIYTGGVNPYFWRPVVGIGAFDCPSYTLDITPLVALLVDGGRDHTIGLQVAGIIEGGSWLVDASLHLWVDPSVDQVNAGLTMHQVAPSVTPVEDVRFFPDGIDARCTTAVHRESVLEGFVATPAGNLTTRVAASSAWESLNEILNGTYTGATWQSVSSRYSVETRDASSGELVVGHVARQHFPLQVYIATIMLAGGGFVLNGTYEHAFSHDKLTATFPTTTITTLMPPPARAAAAATGSTTARATAKKAAAAATGAAAAGAAAAATAASTAAAAAAAGGGSMAAAVEAATMTGGDRGSFREVLRNSQRGSAYYSSGAPGFGSMEQTYFSSRTRSSGGGGCYGRSLRVKNSTFLRDSMSTECPPADGGTPPGWRSRGEHKSASR